MLPEYVLHEYLLLNLTTNLLPARRIIKRMSHGARMKDLRQYGYVLACRGGEDGAALYDGASSGNESDSHWQPTVSSTAVAERADRAAVAGQVGMVSMMSMDEEEQSAEAKQCLTALKEGKRRVQSPVRPLRHVEGRCCFEVAAWHSCLHKAALPSAFTFASYVQPCSSLCS